MNLDVLYAEFNNSQLKINKQQQDALRVLFEENAKLNSKVATLETKVDSLSSHIEVLEAYIENLREEIRRNAGWIGN